MEQQLRKTVVEAEKTGENLSVGSFSSSNSFPTFEISSGSSLESDSFEEVTSPWSSSSSSGQLSAADPLSDMSSLFLQLPIKRGLSKYYQGKSQSFASLANVKSVEDLPKAENPWYMMLKYCINYEGELGETQKVIRPSHNAVSRPMPMKGLHSSTRGSCFTLSAKRGINGPPVAPHESTSITTIANHTALFV